MNLRNLFRVSAVLLLLSGLAWLFAPQAASIAGDLDSYGLYVIQQLGASTIAIAVLLFLVSGMESSPARRAVAIFVFVQQALSGVVNLMAVLGGIVPGAAGWFGFAFNLVFVLAFGYFSFVRPEESRTPEYQP